MKKLFVLSFFIFSSFFTVKLFYPIYLSEEIIITYGINPFDICSNNLQLWNIIKLSYIFVFIFSWKYHQSLSVIDFLISNIIYANISHTK